MTTTGQIALDLPGFDSGPDLTTYRWILANISGGKDSMAMLVELIRRTDAAGVPRDRIVCVHADLGRAEWEGTRELAAEHAAAFGLRFEVVARIGADLVDRIAERGMFPDAANRWCTSDFKRGPVRRLMTALVREAMAAGHVGQVRILNVMGLRADESPARRRLLAFSHDGALTCPCADCRMRRAAAEAAEAQGVPCPKDKKPGHGASNTLRHVDTWHPVHAWSTKDVWAAVTRSGLRPHPAYAEGMPRLSCSFCVLASRPALVRAAQLRPELAAEYAEIEAKIGHRFKDDVSMAEIITEAARATAVKTIPCWQG